MSVLLEYVTSCVTIDTAVKDSIHVTVEWGLNWIETITHAMVINDIHYSDVCLCIHRY